MKISTVIIFFTISLASAYDATGQNALISLNIKNRPVSEVLDKIEKQSNYFFFYNNKEVDVNRTVSVDVENKQLRDVLDIMFGSSKIRYSVLDKSIILSNQEILMPISVTEKAQGITVTGRVTDGAGEAMPGVNVVVKGSTTGVVTDAFGKYSIEVPVKSAILVFSFVGYVSQDATVDNRTEINIALNEDTREIEEVVVIGYGSVKKQNLTASISKMNDEAIQGRPISSLSEAFQGQLAGVRAQNTTGIPGQDLVVRIRGFNTINGDSNPLYVIDGVPRSNMNDINPSDITSIQVLKDASATAIYGARGGNGVILVETKKGTGKPSVDFEAYYGIQTPEKKLNMMNKDEWVAYNIWRRNVHHLRSGGSMSDAMSTRDPNNQIPDEWYTIDTDTDWQDAISQTAPMQNYQLSASGQNDLGSVYFSGGYLSQDGIIKYTYYNRINFRLNASLNVGKKLKFGINLAPSFSNQDKRHSEGKERAVHHALNQSPLAGLKQGTRDWGYPEGLGQVFTNPLERLKYTMDMTKRAKVLSSVWGEMEIIDGLKFKSLYSYNYTGQSYEFFQPGNVNSSYVTSGNSDAGMWTDWSIQNTLTYDKLFKYHHLNLLLGQSAEDNYTYRIFATASGWPDETLPTLNLAITPTKAQTTRDEYKTASFFGRATYDYKEKYLFSASIRYDGSSRFGTNKKWGMFPSVSAGWKLNEESFLKTVDWVTLLKLRVAWGMSGNDRIGDYDYMGLLGSYNTSWNNAVVAGTAPSRIANPNLQWEATKTTDIGIDFSLFNNRLQLTFDYYVNTTDNLLFDVPIPYTTGFDTYKTNLGKIQNKGWEIDLTSYNLTGRLKWSTSLNFSANKNEVLDMGSIRQFTQSSFDGQFITRVGGPVSQFYVYRTNGLLTTSDFEADRKTAKVPIMQGQEPGNIKFVDQPSENHPAGDGKINSDDQVPYGNNLPKLIYGMTNRWEWKGLELSVLVQGQYGGEVMFLAQRHLDFGGEGGLNMNLFPRWLNCWKPDYEAIYGPGENPIPTELGINMEWDGVTYNPIGVNHNNTDLRIYDASFFRIKNITLAYNLPKKILDKIKMKQLKFYVSLDNVKTFDNYPGVTPETNSYGNENTRMGVDYTTYPLSRKYIFGMNVTF